MRTLSAAITTEIAKLSAIPRTLYVIEMKSKATGATNILRVTNHDSDITFQSQTYSSYRVKHSTLKTYLRNQVDNCTITIDNVDKSMSSFFAYNDFASEKAEIYKVFLDSNGDVIDGYPTTDDKIIQFIGFMDRPQANESTATLRVVNVFDRGRSFTPWRLFQYRCNWDFCSELCTFNGGTTKPRGVATDPGTTTTLIDTALTLALTYRKAGDINNDGSIDDDDVAALEAAFGSRPGDGNWNADADLNDDGIVNGADLAILAKYYGKTPSNYLDSYLIGGLLKIIKGAGAGEQRPIFGYNHGTRTIEVGIPFSSATGTTSEYIVECDKLKPSCETLANISNFGGYPETHEAFNSWKSMTGSGGKLTARREARFIDETKLLGRADNHLPIIYGVGAVDGTIIESASDDGGLFGFSHTAIYAFCEGEIDSILGVDVNGEAVDRDNTWAYVEKLGTYNQTISSEDLHGSWELPPDNEYYFHGTVFSCISSRAPIKKNHKISGPPANWFRGLLSDDITADGVVASIKGLLIQKYTSGGAIDGSPVWSNNPSWCVLDFIEKRCIEGLDSSLIDYVSFYTAAQQCETLGYILNLVLTDQTKDSDTISIMLTACRGFLTYSDGKMYMNIEKKWDGDVSHSFDDASSGKTDDNIISGSFEYSKADVNDSHNRVVVDYIDQEIRQNMALIVGYLDKDVTTIPYDDLRGDFTTTGTIYIGAEAISYTGQGTKTLTGCSARTKDYPSGFPLFQGLQTYPKTNAIYNDYDNQDKIKRAVVKSINGSAVPTYRQAYNLAEWHGRKAIEGNQFSKFKGEIDSLHVTVGDVVNVTHSLSGWIDAEFRVVSASETEDEEIEYSCELYDDSFYPDNDVSASVSLATTLQNPFAVLGHVTNLGLSEDGYTNIDGTYVPTLTVTYDLPQESLFYSHAIIHIRTGSESDYREYPGNDISRGDGFVLNGTSGVFSTGETVYVKVIAVNSEDVSSDPATAPTISNKIDGLTDDPGAPSGLILEGGSGPTDYVWDGLRFAVVWRGGSQAGGAGAEPAGQEVQGAGGVAIDSFWKYDEVEVWTGGELRHTFNTKTLRFEYIHGDGFDAFLDSHMVTSNGTVTLKVRRWNMYNRVSDSNEITLTQQSPNPPSGLTATQWMDSVQFNWDMSTEVDLSHYTYRYKIDAGAWGSWTDEIANSVFITADAGEQITIEVRAVDLFNQESSSASTNGTAQGLNIDSTDINDFAVTASKTFTKIPILESDSWTDDSPSANYVAWNAHPLYYNGARYDISVGNTNKKYIYWVNGASVYSSSDTNPVLSDGDFIITTNVDGAHDLAWNANANEVIGSAYIQKLAVQDAHISDCTVDKLTAGTITSKEITLAVQGGTGDAAIKAGKTDFGDDANGGFILGIDDSDSDKAKLEVGDADTWLKYQDGTGVVIKGSITVTGGEFPAISDSNMVFDPNFAKKVADGIDYWIDHSQATYGATLGEYSTPGCRIDANGVVNDVYASVYYPAQINDVFYVKCRVYVPFAFNGVVNIGVSSYNEDKEDISNWPDAGDFGSTDKGFWKDYEGTITATGATLSFVRFRMSVRDSATAGFVFFSSIYISRVANGADVTGDNTAADILNLPATPTGSGLFCNNTYLGFYGSGAWKSYIDSSGNMKLGDPSAAKGLQWTQSTGVLDIRGTLNADDLVAGTITGRTLQTASSGQRMVVGAATNDEMVFYETGSTRLATIGISTEGSDSVIANFGHSTSARIGVYAESTGSSLTPAIYGESHGVASPGVSGVGTHTLGIGVQGSGTFFDLATISSGIVGLKDRTTNPSGSSTSHGMAYFKNGELWVKRPDGSTSQIS